MPQLYSIVKSYLEASFILVNIFPDRFTIRKIVYSGGRSLHSENSQTTIGMFWTDSRVAVMGRDCLE